MDRTPPREVKRTLRKEVGFGCPICRSPFLTYHHFDPTWAEKEHHEPEGMIALCIEHHPSADAKAYDKDYLRELKACDYSAETVVANFPWATKAILLRLGRCYAGKCKAIMPVHGESVLSIDEDANGMSSLSFDLAAEDNTPVALMADNDWLLLPESVHDLKVTTSGLEIQIWHAERDIGLHLQFNRLSKQELSDLIDADAEESKAHVVNRWIGRQSFDQRKDLRDAFQADRKPYGMLPDSYQANIEGIPQIAKTIKDWALTHCLDSDERVPCLNVENLKTWQSGRLLHVRAGKTVAEPIVLETLADEGFSAVFP